jgi:tRNA pseudouridine38-40 synthase
VATTCAGRTDRGVHALAQVVHVDVPHRLALPLLVQRLDKLVGNEITIWSITEVTPDFDARFGAIERAYHYAVADQPIDPRDRHRVWDLGRPLRIRPMQQAVKVLLGEHDYASFCRRPPGGTTTRRIDAITVARRDRLVHVRLRGPAFCHQQVRSIVGCLVEIGLGRRPAEWLGEVLAARDRATAARVAPPHGLTLEAVRYPRSFADAPPPQAG